MVFISNVHVFDISKHQAIYDFKFVGTNGIFLFK